MSAATSMASSRPVSVVIPTRAGYDTLPRALDSLVPNAVYIQEVLLVLSNATADYRLWCERRLADYAAHWHGVLLDSGAESNPAKARNLGCDAAQGRYVAFLDDDDEWMPHKLATYLSVIARQGLSEDFVLFSTVVSCREDRSDWLLFPGVAYRGQPIAEFILSTYGGVQTSAILLPAALARRVRFDPRLARHTDYDFCMRLGEAGARFEPIDEPLSYWYRRGSSVAKGASFEFCLDWLAANRHRLSRSAFIGYLEKELLACARQSGRRREFLSVWRRELSVLERLAALPRLTLRALRKLTHPFSAGRRGRYRPSAARNVSLAVH